MSILCAIALRIIQLCSERAWTHFKLSFESAVPNSTISNILLKKCKGCNIVTILNICRGFRISLAEFFSSPLFSDENLLDD